jgi:hypothetical protein
MESFGSVHLPQRKLVAEEKTFFPLFDPLCFKSEGDVTGVQHDLGWKISFW